MQIYNLNEESNFFSFFYTSHLIMEPLPSKDTNACRTNFKLCKKNPAIVFKSKRVKLEENEDFLG